MPTAQNKVYVHAIINYRYGLMLHLMSMAESQCSQWNSFTLSGLRVNNTKASNSMSLAYHSNGLKMFYNICTLQP